MRGSALPEATGGSCSVLLPEPSPPASPEPVCPLPVPLPFSLPVLPPPGPFTTGASVVARP